MQSVDLMNPIS